MSDSWVEQLGTVLIVDDEPDALSAMQSLLLMLGIADVLTVDDPRQVMAVVAGESGISLVLLDLLMPHLDGEQVLTQLQSVHPEIPVIMMTAVNEAAPAVRCVQHGAFDYLTKPVARDRLLAAMRNAMERRALQSAFDDLQHSFHNRQLQHPEAFESLVTRDRQMLRIFNYVESIAHSAQSVLITGQTGTGKELIARAVHTLGGGGGRFIGVNVGGLDDAMFTDTLFGHQRGAFTGAGDDRRGMIEQAAGGTLFLDEIGELAGESQVKLLRVLQEREYCRLGSDRMRPVQARIVAATQADVSQMRRDLYFRLRSHHIHLPPLRDRPDDLLLLLDHFLSMAADELGKTKPTIPAQLPIYLGNYGFPGNVRELRAMVYDAMAQHEQGVLSMASFTRHMSDVQPVSLSAARGDGDRLIFPATMPTLRQLQSLAIEEALGRSAGNQRAAANMLGINRVTISRFLKNQDDPS